MDNETKQPENWGQDFGEDFNVVKSKRLYWNPKKEGEIIDGVFSRMYIGNYKHERIVFKCGEYFDEESKKHNNCEVVLPNVTIIRDSFDKNDIGHGYRIRYDGCELRGDNKKFYRYTIGRKNA